MNWTVCYCDSWLVVLLMLSYADRNLIAHNFLDCVFKQQKIIIGCDDFCFGVGLNGFLFAYSLRFLSYAPLFLTCNLIEVC